MTTLTFDTYKFVSKLQKAGFDEKQATTLVNELQEINLDHLATKNDLMQMEARLGEKIVQAQNNTLKFIFPMLMGQLAAFALIMKFLLSF